MASGAHNGNMRDYLWLVLIRTANDSCALSHSRARGGKWKKARKQETWKRTKSDYSCEHWKIFTVEQQLYFPFDVNGKAFCCKQATRLSMNFNYNRPSELRTERDSIGSGDAHCWGAFHCSTAFYYTQVQRVPAPNRCCYWTCRS